MNPLVRDLAKSGIDIAQDAYVKAATLLGFINYPVPPNSNMRQTSSRGIRHYLFSSSQTGLPIVTALRMLGYSFPPNDQVLDFGAGVGRQLLYFTRRFPQLRFFACDVEPSHIEWITRQYPTVEAYRNQYNPPLKYEDAKFNVIYSVSIFSHLPTSGAISYLEEFKRIVKPGGFACLTTLGFTATKVVPNDDRQKLVDTLQACGYAHEDSEGLEEAKARAKKRKIVKSTEMVSGLETGYGVTFMSPAYIKEHWAEHGFDVVAVVEGVIDDLQDLVILRRSAS